jgi:hypothetical protein
VKSPALWGKRERMAELFGPAATSIKGESRNFAFRYRSAEHFMDVFKTYYGPTHKAFAALDARGQRSLETDLVELLEAMNVGGAESLVVPSEYLEVVVVKD